MKKAKHKKETNKFKKVILNIILILFLISIIISIYNIIIWLKNNKETEKTIEEISNAVTVEESNDTKNYKIDFEQLKKVNSETVGWLKVNGTEIKYPVVKYTDNDFYLSHSFDKSNNGAGWPFADYRNKMDNTDKNTIIYGHNRRDGSMFSTLKNILNKSWYENEENRKIIFITEKGNFEYQVFSAYQIEAENYDITTAFSSNEQFVNYVEKAKSKSIYNFNVDVDSSDNILTISTCADNNEYRIVLQSKLIK